MLLLLGTALGAVTPVQGAEWDCRRTPDGQGWTCSKGPDRPQPAAPAEPTPAEPTPVQTRPDTPPPAASEPLPAEPPAQEPTAPPQPVLREARPEPGPQPPEPAHAATPEPAAAPPAKPAPARTAASAWSCRPGAGGEWECERTGPLSTPTPGTPGEAAGLATAEPQPSFDPLYAPLLAQLPFDPWAACGTGEPAPVVRPQPKGPVSEDVIAESDSAHTDPAGRTILTGNVDITLADQNVRADAVTYDPKTGEVQTDGRAIYSGSGYTVSSADARFNILTDQGDFRDNRFILLGKPARGTAAFSHIENRDISEHRQATYTTCQPGNNDWLVTAQRFRVDRARGRGIARNATLRFKDVPVLYTPYFSYPIDDRRSSGLLAPTIGFSDETGFDLTVPYYFNLAPNYDFTFAPRYLSQRGILLGGEFRHISSYGRNNLEFELIPEDTTTGKPRGQLSFLNRTRFSRELTAQADINYISDQRYLQEISNALGNTRNRQVRSDVRLNYRTDNLLLLARADNFQTLDETLPPDQVSYSRLPQLLAEYGDRLDGQPLAWNVRGEAAYFDRPIGLDPNDPRDGPALAANPRANATGARLDIAPRISFPWRTTGAFVEPALSLRHTQYFVDSGLGPGQTFLNTTSSGATVAERVQFDESRTVPTAALDAGLLFDRSFDWGGHGYTQTLEPRLYYLYVPDVDQDAIPVFDTTELDFNFNQLFRENRYGGVDRIGDANQLTLALRTRVEDETTGLDRLDLGVGSILYFDEQDVGLPGERLDRDLSSDLVAQLGVGLSQHWRFQSAIQYDPNRNQNRRSSIALRYRDENNYVFNIGHRFRRDVLDTRPRPPVLENINQSDVGARLPLGAGWTLLGRWVYSWRDNVTLDSFLGFEKESCCYRLSVLGRRFVTDRQGGSSNAVFLQIELKGLTRFGNPLDKFLQRNLEGYE